MNKNQVNDELHRRFLQAQHDQTDRFNLQDEDMDSLITEKIMDNIHNTSLGKLLGIIATLPEIRQEKVDQGKRLLSRQEADLDEHLDVAMDRVLEELLFGI
jgi:uncharacterized protein YegJ (DUF2314 family)